MVKAVYLLIGFDSERPRHEIEPPKTFPPKNPKSYYMAQAAELNQNLKFISKINGACNKLRAGRTFFVLGKYLQVALHAPPGTKSGAKHREKMKALIRKSFDAKNPLVDIQSHGFSHRPFEDVQGRKAIPASQVGKEFRIAEKAKQNVFGKGDASIGLRGPLGYPGGLKKKTAIRALEKQGVLFISTDLRGSKSSVYASQTAAFPRQPRFVGKKLVEMPSHGWQDTAFVAHPETSRSKRFLGNPAEIKKSLKSLIDNAVKISSSKNRNVFVGLTLHPWAMRRYDPKLEIFCSVLKYAKSKGVRPVSYTQGFEVVSKDIASRRPVAKPKRKKQVKPRKRKFR